MILNINTFKDIRGSIQFIESIKTVKQQFISNNEIGVIRGIHCSPYPKTITCLNGSIIDYIINMKNNTFEKNILRKNNKIYIPPNFGHCFLTLEKNTQIFYQLHGEFKPENEINIHYRDPVINLDISWEYNYIVSVKDINNPFIKPIDYIVLGGTGFLGSYTIDTLKKHNKNFICVDTRLERYDILENQLAILKPKYVISAAGISGNPTVKWCETNKEQTLLVNYTLQLKLAEICKKLNIHLTIYGSGLIYEGNGKYSETDKPNHTSLYYSQLRIRLEKDLVFDNLLYLRILYPISGDGNKKCFLSKIKTRFNSTHNIQINCTVLPELFPYMIKMIETHKFGIFNFVNPNLISIPDIIKIYYTHTKHTIIDIKTENPDLDTHKLTKLYPEIKNIYKCITDLK
jgi:3,5-epimerase/4-reductase